MSAHQLSNMKKYILILGFAILTVLFGVLIINPPKISAVTSSGNASANQQAGQALEIAPPVLNLKADPGETIQAKISLRDVSSSPLLVTNEINDFTAVGEDGTPKIILEEAEPSPYSIVKWISPIPSITLKARQIQNVPVTINIPKDAAPGGYYGVVRFTATPPEIEGNGVSLSTSIGALIFVRVNGDAKEKISIEEFYVGKDDKKGFIFNSTPLQFTERIKNEGNVHEQPIGRILVKDLFGRPAVNLNVNLEGRNVLPGTIRKFQVPLDKTAIGDRTLIGPYTATLTVKYGSSGQTVTQDLTFWIIPWKIILIVLAVIVVLIIGGRFGIKRYNEWIVSKSRGPRRR